MLAVFFTLTMTLALFQPTFPALRQNEITSQYSDLLHRMERWSTDATFTINSLYKSG